MHSGAQTGKWDGEEVYGELGEGDSRCIGREEGAWGGRAEVHDDLQIYASF